MVRMIVVIIMIPVFVYSFFLTSWTASYLPYIDDWKEHLLFTPQTITDPTQIYGIDKLFYTFSIQPMISVICLFSFFISVVILLHWFFQKLVDRRKKVRS